MAIDPKVMQLVSKTLGLGDGGLVADSEGAALAYKFTSEQAADKAIDALEGIRGAAFDVAGKSREPDGTYKVVMYEGNFNVITTFKSSEVEVAKTGLSEAMTLDRNTIAANDKKFAALQAAVNPNDLSFESREDADGMHARINRFIPVNLGSLDNLSTVQKSPDGRWVVEFNKAQVGKYSRTVDEIAKDVAAFRQALDKQTDNQKPSMQALSSGLGVGIRMDGDVNSFKMEGIPEGKMDELVAKLNTISPGMAEKAEGRIVIREEKLAEQRFDYSSKLPIEQPRLKTDFRDLPIDKQAILVAAKEMISSNYVELLNKSKFSNGNNWATAENGSDKQQIYFDKTKGFAKKEDAEAEAQKLSGEFKLTPTNGFSARMVGDKYYATISQRSLQLEGGAKAIAEANAAAAAVVPPPPMLPVATEAPVTTPTAPVAAPAAPATTPAAETPPATPPAATPEAVPNPAAPTALAPTAPAPTVTPSAAPAAGAAGTAGTVTAPAPSTTTPPPAEDTVGNNLFTIIGAAIPALLMLAGGVDVGLGLLLLLGGLFLGGMFDKPKGGFVGKMVDNVMGKNGPSLGGMDIDKNQNISKDELATALDKDKSGKIDTKELSALSEDERKKLFDALQASNNREAARAEGGNMVEVDLSKITAPINLPAAPAGGTGTGTPGK